MKQTNVRHEALRLLMRIEKGGGFSHLLLSQSIRKAGLNSRDERLLTEIVYGTIERKITLDFYLQESIQHQKKLTDWVLMLLRMSVFQMVYLDKIPVFAIINEAVQIAKQKGHKGIAAFVNGVLRHLDRTGLPDVKKLPDPIEQVSIETSHPKWLIERWGSYYGLETAIKICQANMIKKPMAVRVNSMKITREAMIQKLEEAGFTVAPSAFVEDAILILEGNILKTAYVKEGFVTIQDQASMLAAKLLGVKQHMQVLDTCSAPGGKATYIGELMKNTGQIHAFDLHRNKINLIQKNAQRLGLTNIKAAEQDARKLQTMYEPETFERILVDVPCSGFGVIRSKPDIKYSKQKADIRQLQQTQVHILTSVAPLLQTGGALVYSTCTIEKMENEAVIEQFLNDHQHWQVDDVFLKEMKENYENARITEYGMQLFPQSYETDGFFITKMIKQVS